MNVHTLQHLEGQWRQHLGAVQMAWARLRHKPELHHAGHMQRLAGLLQASHGFSRCDADAQVQGFFASKSQRDNSSV